MYHCRDNLSGINGVLRPGIVHRIDMNTTKTLHLLTNNPDKVYQLSDFGMKISKRVPIKDLIRSHSTSMKDIIEFFNDS